MPKLVELHLKPETLAQYGLPDIPYPMPATDLESALRDKGDLPLAVILHGLQQRSRDGQAQWQQLEPAMERITELLTPENTHKVISAAGDHWWLEVGPVDLSARVVTIQRGDSLIAAISARDDGRLRVAVFRPLDAKSAAYLIGLAQVPHPTHGVCMRDNNWEYALDCSAGNGNHYADVRGQAYLSYWSDGVGMSSDGSEVPDWRKQQGLVAQAAAYGVTQLGIYYTLYSDDDSQPAAETQDAEEVAVSVPPTLHSKRQQKRTVQERFRGCLLGGAVGDALGAPVEFMSRAEILRRFGAMGITEYAPAYGGLGTITDDTQMTLFTAEGLIRGWVRGCFKGTTSYPSVTAHAYLRWLQTQGASPCSNTELGTNQSGWLLQQHELHCQRAPGNTCLSALRAMDSLGAQARNNSKGCGGVMRVAPVGLFSWRLGQQASSHDAFLLGAELAGLTHGHPTGALTGGVLAVLVLAVTDGASLPEALAASKAILQTQTEHKETLKAIERAQELADSDLAYEQAVARLGQGWIAEEALAISIYCVLVARTFKQGIILAVNHDGDSDSTGSIVGNLLGALHGVKAIPGQWLEGLELRDVITEMADDLYAFKDWEIGEYKEDGELNQRIWQRYPGY